MDPASPEGACSKPHCDSLKHLLLWRLLIFDQSSTRMTLHVVSIQEGVLNIYCDEVVGVVQVEGWGGGPGAAHSCWDGGGL